jgi:hydroxymethylglutaryl-CoA synthase
MRGILSAAAYVPFRRLQRAEIRTVMGSGGGSGTRSVASFDEDTTTMAVEACRLVQGTPDQLWFATANPAYLDKTNAAAIHAALRFDGAVPALDFGGAIRSGIGALKAGLNGNGTTLVASSDIRTGLPTSTDESQGGDAAAAALIGEGDVLAELIGEASITHEFVERWRTPGDNRSKTWEDRFGEAMYLPLAEEAWNAALKSADLTVDQIDIATIAGMHARSVQRFARQLKQLQSFDVAATVGNAGIAQAQLLLTQALETAQPNQVVALISLADGADVLLFKIHKTSTPKRTVAQQIETAKDVPYARFLSWRGMITPEPPNRPEPARVSAPAAERADDWKFGLSNEHAQLADERGTIVTFTVDRLAYSPSPPVVFAIVDFDNGQRLPLELTDVDPDELSVGDKVEMTFRKLSTADGIHNYFWKARPVR